MATASKTNGASRKTSNGAPQANGKSNGRTNGKSKAMDAVALPKADHPKGPSGTRLFHLRTRSGWGRHTLQNAAGQKATLAICVRCRNYRGQWKRHGRQALVYGYWGLPALGVKGAAIAVGIAEAIGVVFLWWRSRPVLRPSTHLRLDLIRTMWHVGAPVSGERLVPQPGILERPAHRPGRRAERAREG